SHGKKTVRLRIGSVRSSNVSHIVAEIINSIPKTSAMKIEFRETSQFELLNLVESNELDLGMISFPRQHKAYFSLLMKSKNIAAQPIRQRPIYLLMSAESPLTKADHIDISMLADYTEVIHGDLDSSEMQYSKWMADAGITIPHRSVLIYDRGSMMDILSNCHDCFKWTNATHPELLKAYNLVAKECATNMMIDEMVIYSKNRRLTKDFREYIKRFKDMADYEAYH
ncbi:MAG: LysR family transcriptional regulator substrate-binding protein, partial [Anaerolineales bacterium]|nr:LysR family transcriptional regulator substrate-binding protein [Anaerolineales bacterium]